MKDLVVLVDEENNPIGVSDKETVHTKHTALHRAFSLFLFNSRGELLLTKRASTKKTFPGVWTNTVCGHLQPNETSVEAATRRLEQELGIREVTLQELSPYRYRFADVHGIVENEICPIIIGYYDGNPRPNPEETEEWKWIDWQVFLGQLESSPSSYSPWCREEARIIRKKLPQIGQGTP